MLGEEAREHPRARARVKVEYHFGSTTGVGHSNDLSESGMFLHCHQTASPGTRVYLRLHLPGSRAGDPLKIIGMVTRAIDVAVDPARAGMGIHFEVAYSRTRDQLSDFITNLLMLAGSNEPQVKLLAGSDDTYVARFPELQNESYQPLASLRPPEVERVFAFDAAEPAPVAWNKIASVAVKLVAALAIVGVIVYFFLAYAGKFSRPH